MIVMCRHVRARSIGPMVAGVVSRGPRGTHPLSPPGEQASTDGEMMASRSPIRLARAVAVAVALTVAFAAAAGGAGGAPAPATVEVPAGPFVAGSDRAGREAAYRLDEAAYGHGRTRQWRWYESERQRTRIETAAYAITETPITNAQYAAFVAATGHPAPDVDAGTWASYKLIHPYERTRRFAWTGGRPPKGRGGHPVVLVSFEDARA